MPTDWNLIREMMAAAIDACEQIEAAGYTELDSPLDGRCFRSKG